MSKPLAGLASARLAFVMTLVAGLFALAAAASAQSRSGGEDRGAAPGAFDYYVLALSWSPGFCTLTGDARGSDQCEPGKGLGFVVHGLWPQYDRGYPTECRPAGRTPSRIALKEAEGLFPSEGLARYEWRKHGTCSGKSPSDYFADVRRAREAVTIPPAFRDVADSRRWTPIDLERAFVAANPGLRTDMMSVSCRRGSLEEVRICFSKDLRRFQTCPGVDRSGCRGGTLRIDPVR